MDKPELGSKHHCENCGARFFDLNRSPVTCPKCGAVAEIALRAPQRIVEAEEEETPAGPETELVSLDEAGAEEDKAAAAPEDEAEIDAPDDTFLEEEEEDEGDVGNLIDGDIGDEEER
ncbi:MAG: TIGR02300 family protein [Beijerinckiaceae bacterium]|nr:TIGR02300 family protein [Beijerinckiaceae bacterium]MCI0736188.1 TIGR02300 family protein [Beijerinckiaceae bacterium]